jgi:hypothetical protein
MAKPPIRIRRSAVPGAIPTTEQLSLGELAINTFDGKAFLKKDDGTESIVGMLPTTGGTLTGALGVIEGSAESPSIYFDSNSGFYSPGEDQVAIATNGEGRIFIDAGGKVGIGAPASSQNLYVDGTVESSTYTTRGSLQVARNNSVRSFINDQGSYFINDLSAARFIPTGSTVPTNGMYLPSANNVAFATNGAGRLFIDSSGNVDIGGDLQIDGNLTVSGLTTTLETETILVEDKNIELGVVTTPTDATADSGGITLKGTTDKTITWLDATNAWTFSEHVDLASEKEYRIDGVSVLSSTTLGSSVANSSLTSVGTITTGTWEATEIAVTRGGTGQTTYSEGDALVGTSAGGLETTSTSTGAIILPVGTTEQRPSSPVVGMFRFNSETGDFEGYNGIEWTSLSAPVAEFTFEGDLETLTGTEDLQTGTGTVDLL